jgi:hypothetical protein
MNLIKFKKNIKFSDNNFLVKDFRKADAEKLEFILQDMFSRIKALDNEYNFDISFETVNPNYLNLNNSYYDRVTINQNYKEYKNTITFLVPKLVQNNFYILNNMVYVPLLFLEKAPIDRIYIPEENKNKIFANINAVFNFTFDFESNNLQFKGKSIEMELFFRIFFDKDTEYLEELKEKGYIEKIGYTKEEFKKFIKFFNFHKVEFFEEMDIAQFLDNQLLLEYYRDVFDNFFGTRTLADIFKKIIYINEEKFEINMADLRNRRVVLLEYLIRPIFEIYLRLLFGIIDKNNQNFLPTMNELSIMTTGFNKNLHRGNLYDLSLPFPAPLIHKVSQAISIIQDGRLPKSWTENNPSGFGKICPISISSQNTALNLIFTSETQLNIFGKIEIDQDNLEF